MSDTGESLPDPGFADAGRPNAGARRPDSASAGASVAAIVLAGGAGSRMGGVDKPALELDGSTLLARCMAAAQAVDCFPVVVVGREVGGGPVAALADGIARIPTSVPEAILLAGDLVHPDRIVTRLVRAAIGERDGVVLVDPDGREQWLAARYRLEPLRDALAALGDPVGASLRRLVLDLARVPAPAEELADVDTWQDYERATAHAKGQTHG